MILIIATVFVLGTLIYYSCCVAGARADKYSEHYFQLEEEEEEEEEYHGKHFRKE